MTLDVRAVEDDHNGMKSVVPPDTDAVGTAAFLTTPFTSAHNMLMGDADESIVPMSSAPRRNVVVVLLLPIVVVLLPLPLALAPMIISLSFLFSPNFGRVSYPTYTLFVVESLGVEFAVNAPACHPIAVLFSLLAFNNALLPNAVLLLAVLLLCPPNADAPTAVLLLPVVFPRNA
jgi:hypothetical protein